MNPSTCVRPAPPRSTVAPPVLPRSTLATKGYDTRQQVCREGSKRSAHLFQSEASGERHLISHLCRVQRSRTRSLLSQKSSTSRSQSILSRYSIKNRGIRISLWLKSCLASIRNFSVGARSTGHC